MNAPRIHVTDDSYHPPSRFLIMEEGMTAQARAHSFSETTNCFFLFPNTFFPRMRKSFTGQARRIWGDFGTANIRSRQSIEHQLLHPQADGGLQQKDIPVPAGGFQVVVDLCQRFADIQIMPRFILDAVVFAGVAL